VHYFEATARNQHLTSTKAAQLALKSEDAAVAVPVLQYALTASLIARNVQRTGRGGRGGWVFRIRYSRSTGGGGRSRRCLCLRLRLRLRLRLFAFTAFVDFQRDVM